MTVLKVEGMSCNHCKMAVEKAVKAVAGVESVQVNLDKKEVVVNGSADRAQVAKAIEEAGYEVVG
ncbi:copper ion binding protein [Desulfotomaculum nigrificans CO-1-SRB]|uniref:Copper ion binding protein n=1 Tax=Desulfotomaculum nigrificans (strain DSM 14880 / VKM B-2319 / CO-1-SRB) TaxID=868595 RepID=F6B6V7_DESCC|nr:copper ion binding protein [Desulfotomaculum nigrificans]AEF93282.1 copper ion binding protein [Desulfotomaculum nigrificans CO-1-SRB]